MSVKHYGIYIAYPPMADLKKEGLGRYLALFLKGAERLPNVKFTIVCPSWSGDSLTELFQSERVSVESINIQTPQGVPYALRIYERLFKRRKGPRRRWVAECIRKTKAFMLKFWHDTASRAVRVHSVFALVEFIFSTGLMLLLMAIIGAVVLPFALVAVLGVDLVGRLRRLRTFHRVLTMFAPNPGNGLAMHLFDEMHNAELNRMQAIIATLHDVSAWYCPVAFWPSFHNIEKPRLICIPDVWPTQFPVGFSNHGSRLNLVVDRIGESIFRANHLVTYSDEIKWGTLVEHYGLNPEKISVIHHAPNRMDAFNAISGSNREMSSKYCRALLLSAIRRSANPEYSTGFQNSDVKYIFYASQFRPNKNVLNLLCAYLELLRRRHIQHKLLLTGHSEEPDVKKFVLENRLENDVLFLHNLSLKELAACYQLADLAVNPSFAEGGCPFTFTEALSVGTPVVMARIPVTEEILTDPALQQRTFFDPYSWEDCADRIEWGLRHRDELLSVQSVTYEALSRRTWTDVVSEHVSILERISSHA